jgi:hypothetical protein
LDALASGLDLSAIHLGHRLKDVEERNDRIVLAFENGVHVEAGSVHGSSNRVWGYDPIGEWNKGPVIPTVYGA